MSFSQRFGAPQYILRIRLTNKLPRRGMKEYIADHTYCPSVRV